MSTNCGCEPKKYNFSMGCCVPVLGPIENYYTKPQIDRMIDEIESAITSGCCITPEEVDEKIEEAISGITVSGVTEEQMNQAITSAMTIVEGEIPSLDGYATEQWVLDKHYITGVDLSDYVTYESLPDLTSYATKQWVINQNYVVNSELIQYITNLQNQIDSLREQISGCCGDTGETLTRWITMTGENDYTCSGTTKMTKEKEQQSTDGGNTWADTGNYRTGDTVIEENCVDCGYIPGTGDGKIHFYRSDLSTNTSTTQCVTAFTDVSTSAYPRNYEFDISGDTVCGLRGMTESSTVVRSVCSVIMPSSTRVIDDFAFYGEAGGEPEQMSSIDRAAVIALNEGIEEIGIKAFYYYVQDTNRLANGSIIIPSTVTSIGLEAFNLDGESFQSKNLSGLKIRFYFKSQTPPSMLNIFGTNSSQMNSAIRIYVPVGTTEAYRQALGNHYSAMEIVEYDGNITYASDVWSYDNLLYQGLIQ